MDTGDSPSRRKPYVQRRNSHTQANYQMWKTMGEKMGIQDLPPSFETMQRFLTSFESKHQGSHPRSPQLARTATELFLKNLAVPSILQPFAFSMIYSLLNARTASCLKMKPPAWLIKLITESLLWCHGMTSGYLVPPQSPQNTLSYIPKGRLLHRSQSLKTRQSVRDRRSLDDLSTRRSLDDLSTRRSTHREFRRFKVE